MKSSYIKWITIIVGLSVLSACGSVSRIGASSRVAYEEVEVRPPLAVPEDLDAVPLNPENELSGSSGVDLIGEQPEPPSAGLDEEVETAVNDSVAEFVVNTNEHPSIIITGDNLRLSSLHPVYIVWQTVGLTLERLGIPVTDRDRSQGLYFVDCLVAAGQEIKERRWWNVFSRDDTGNRPVCELSVVQEGENSEVRFNSSAEGVPAEQEINALLEEFKTDLDII